MSDNDRLNVPPNAAAQNEASVSAWNANAAFWDERMGEGNDFQLKLLAPALEQLLEVRPGMRVLEAACGNGNFSCRLVELGASVVAFDGAPAMIERARERSKSDRLTYHVIDATDREALRSLGGEPFDALVCNMALMDIANIEPLIEVGRELLAPGAPFVFSVQHPCFNSRYSSVVLENSIDPATGLWGTKSFLKLSGYSEPSISRGEAMSGQPALQLYFHRPLQELFGAFFRAGYVLDGLVEPTFDPPAARGMKPDWASMPGIPPVLVARMRVLGVKHH
jgi:2-polyprenyl-3-methyl-5-hydroxy-6-metoxy-1,4-benzoquinol methylase